MKNSISPLELNNNREGLKTAQAFYPAVLSKIYFEHSIIYSLTRKGVAAKMYKHS
jgi:hypothetical protein